MDAGIRHDLVEFSESFEDRAVSMLTKNTRRIETGDIPEDVQVFNYNPRAGEDGQFRLYTYQHSPRGIPSETPRRGQDTDLMLKCQSLTLVDSDEEYESGNYTFSPNASTLWNSTEQTNLPAASNKVARHYCTGPEYDRQASDSRGRVLPNPPPVDDTVPAYPTAILRNHAPLQSQNKRNNKYNTMAPKDNRNTFQRQKDKTLDTWPDMLCNEPPPMLVPASSSEYHQQYGMHIQETGGLLDDGSDSEGITAEKLPDGGKPKLLDLAETSDNEPTEKPNCPKFPQPLDRSQATMKCRPVDPVLIDLPAIYTSDEKPANHNLEPGNLHHEQKYLLDQIRDGAPSGFGIEKASKSGEEKIMVRLGGPDLQSTTTIQVSTPVIELPSTELQSKSDTVSSLDFDSMAHAIFGTGSWIEEDAHNLLINLDVEGLCEVYAIGNHLGTLEDQFDPGSQANFRACPANSSPGSTAQKNAGGNSSESGSRGTRQSPPNGGGRHRKHASEGGDGEGEEDDPGQYKKAKTVNGTNRRFVCPFYFHDPAYFKTSEEHGQKYTLCAAGQGFADIARLKEHLRRTHSPKITCARCGLAFKKQLDLDVHLNLRNEVGPECPVLDLPAPRSMTPDMVAQLAERGKRETNVSEEEKWYKIYQILFPNDLRPTTGAYRQGFDQPPTPSQEKHNLIHICENDLPRLLERRLETQLGDMIPDLESRERMKNMVISELVICIKELSLEPSETPSSFDGSQVLRHKPSEASSIDSGYGSKCGLIDCMGNCNVCEQLTSPMSQQSQGYFQHVNPPLFEPPDQYLNPSMFTTSEPTGHLQSTEKMDELLQLSFPGRYLGNPYLDGSGT